jgi:hypothetical protein
MYKLMNWSANQSNAEALYCKGTVLKLLGRTKEADVAFAKAMEQGVWRLIPAQSSMCNLKKKSSTTLSGSPR